MSKIGIVVDSTFCLNKELLDYLEMEVVSLNIIIENRIYTDGVDISCEDIFDALDDHKKVTTSQPTPEAFLEAFNKLLEKGINNIICFTVSSGISGTYQSANIACEMAKDANIKVIDSRTSAMGGELLLEELKDLMHENSDYNVISTIMEEKANKLNTIFTIDNFEAILKSGRVSKTKAIIGTIMRVKPIMELDRVGKIFIAGKVRSTKRVFEFIINRIERTISLKELLHIRISYISTKVNALKLKSRLEEKFKNARVFISREITPVLGVHLGRGGLGLSWIVK
ncbi:DegV family protein [Mycoplasmatota bacterium zrk1]